MPRRGRGALAGGRSTGKTAGSASLVLRLHCEGSMLLPRLALLVGAALVFAACSETLPANSVEAATTEPPPRVPAVHVAAKSSACGSARGSNEPPDGAGCKSDDQCTAGKNGRCLRTGLGFAECTYDECVADADCGAGGFCNCRGEGATTANRCVVGSDCRTDADCGGPFCSPSLTPGGCGGTSLALQGFFCHSARDECIDNADCAGPDVPGETTCDYDKAEKKWRCSVRECVSD